MYRSRSQFKFLARLMSLVLLLSQSAFTLASMDMSIPVTDKGMSACHSKAANNHERHNQSSASEEAKTCQQDCCGDKDCKSHCQTCLSVTAGALIPVMGQLYQAGFSQKIILKSHQIPNGFNPSSLYRPPRQTV